MPAVVFAVAGALDARSGGSIYNRRIVEALRARGWTIDVIELEGAFPEPDARSQAAAAAAFAALPAGATVVGDGLAMSALPDVVERHAARLTLIALVHLPLPATFGLDEETAARLEAAERRALASVRGVVITGPGARPVLAGYDLPHARVWLVRPGTAPAPLARGSTDGRLRLLCAATLHPGKGHDVLLSALAPLTGVDWELTCAGSLTYDPQTAERLRRLAATLAVDGRVHFIGDVDQARLDVCYAAADLFVLATHQETYGMVVADAIARGIPVIGTDTGAIAELVGDDAGIVVRCGDVDAFSAALAKVMTGIDLRQRLAAGARARRGGLPTWEQAGEQFGRVLEEVTTGG